MAVSKGTYILVDVWVIVITMFNLQKIWMLGFHGLDNRETLWVCDEGKFNRVTLVAVIIQTNRGTWLSTHQVHSLIKQDVEEGKRKKEKRKEKEKWMNVVFST